MKLKTRYGNNISACDWDMHRQIPFECRLQISGVDSQGVLYTIASVLHKQRNSPVRRITLETKDGLFDGTLDIVVYDTSDVKNICDSLSSIENVTKAVRVEM